MATGKKRNKGKNSNYRGTPSARKKAVKRFSKKWLSTIIIAVIVIGAVLAIVLTSGSKNKESHATEPAAVNPTAAIDFSAPIFADIVIEKYGTITVQLDYDAAPISVENFVKLAQSGFYDGLTFHRIMEGFMMQGGAGDSVPTIKGEFSSNGVNNPLSHTRGTISMARANAKDSASSQFFICHQDSTFLDGEYAAFGHVTEGMDVVDAVCEKSEPTDNNGTIPAAKQPVMKTITVYNG